MNNPKGKELKLSDLRGKYVLVDFGLHGVDHVDVKIPMWCGPSSTARRNSKTAMDLKSSVFPSTVTFQDGKLPLTKTNWIGKPCATQGMGK